MATTLKYLHVVNSFQIKLVSLGQGIQTQPYEDLLSVLSPSTSLAAGAGKQSYIYLVQWLYVGPGKNTISSTQ